MRKQKVLAREFDFYFPDLDNLVLVQTLEDGSVRVRFTRDNLSDERKIFLIRELAAEGFIPDHYQRFSNSGEDSLKVIWVKDRSWVGIRSKIMRKTNRFMWGFVVASFIFWIAMMRVVLVSSPPASGVKTAPPSSSRVNNSSTARLPPGSLVP